MADTRMNRVIKNPKINLHRLICMPNKYVHLKFFFLISDFLADISSMEIPPVTADELEDIGMKEVKKICRCMLITDSFGGLG